MSSKTVNVDGMTCDHCVAAVTEEISKIPGVTGVNIDLRANATSPVTIASDQDVSDSDITEAVEEAGYAVVLP